MKQKDTGEQIVIDKVKVTDEVQSYRHKKSRLHATFFVFGGQTRLAISILAPVHSGVIQDGISIRRC
ncbi:MAG: hypothetical protein ACPG5L_05000 [Vibrio gallaecicus]